MRIGQDRSQDAQLGSGHRGDGGLHQGSGGASEVWVGWRGQQSKVTSRKSQGWHLRSGLAT